MAKKIKMLKPGRFKAMNGKVVSLSAADLKATAAAYNPAVYACPMVIGHPTIESPSYGTIGAADFSDNFLTGEPGRVAPEFVRIVNGGYYDHVSLSLFEPDSPANPVPGVYYPRHLGFLGAAAPAVPGLGTVSFAEEEGVVCFALDLGDWNDRTIARMFRNMKNLFIEKFGKEEADKVLDEWDLETITQEALRPEPPAQIEAEPAFADHQKGGVNMLTPEQIAAKEAEFAEREAKLKKEEQGRVHAANVAFAEGLVKKGKLVAAKKDAVVASLDFAAGITAGDVIEFGEGDAKQSQAPLEILKDVFNTAPKVIEFGELGGGDVPADQGGKTIPADLAKHV